MTRQSLLKQVWGGLSIAVAFLGCERLNEVQVSSTNGLITVISAANAGDAHNQLLAVTFDNWSGAVTTNMNHDQRHELGLVIISSDLQNEFGVSKGFADSTVALANDFVKNVNSLDTAGYAEYVRTNVPQNANLIPFEKALIQNLVTFNDADTAGLWKANEDVIAAAKLLCPNDPRIEASASIMRSSQRYWLKHSNEWTDVALMGPKNKWQLIGIVAFDTIGALIGGPTIGGSIILGGALSGCAALI